MWLLAAPAAWLFVNAFGHAGATIAAFTGWLLVCWAVVATGPYGNANHMREFDTVMGLVLLAAPFAAYLVYDFQVAARADPRHRG